MLGFSLEVIIVYAEKLRTIIDGVLKTKQFEQQNKLIQPLKTDST